MSVVDKATVLRIHKLLLVNDGTVASLSAESPEQFKQAIKSVKSGIAVSKSLDAAIQGGEDAEGEPKPVSRSRGLSPL